MAIENLSKELSQFLKSQTTNSKVIQLASEIQNQFILGNTAILNNETIDDPLISNDGTCGYIVQNNGKAGFRRFYNQELYIKNDFLNSNSLAINHRDLISAINSVLKILNLEIPTALDQQWQACLSSLHKSRFILTGGPGTGKTTTVIRMMLLYLTLDNTKNIALSAPTGKAANQMMHSIAQQLIDVDVPDELKQRLQIKAQTIHRLLGYNNQTNKVKYNKNNPLPYDLVIIDESSMLDVSLTYALLQALKPKAQLILIGDKNQLPAVEAGNVFSDLCQLINSDNVHDSSNLLNLIITEEVNQKIIPSYVELTKNYRFTDDSLIAQMCRALTHKKTSILYELKNTNALNWSDPQTKSEKKQKLNEWYHSISKEQSAILLSPVNNGPNSVAELNDMAREILYNNHTTHENMPIMVTQNDYALNIFNGDIGELTLINNQWHVALVIEGEQKHLQLQALPVWQQANAITIHKAQGSEYDHVLIAIPNDVEINILNNALLYTAISRAKVSVTLWANDKIVEKIIKTSKNRLTFLNN